MKNSKSQTVKVGQSIVFGGGDDAERGVVIGIDGDLVTVAWEQGCETTQTASYLGLEVTLEYQIAFQKSDGTWDIVETFEACGDDAANRYAEAAYPGTDWYVLCDGQNING